MTVVNPLQAAMVEQAAVTAGHALSCAFTRKMRESDEDCSRQGIRFFPMVAETLGGLDNVVIREVKKLAAAKARHTGAEEDDETRKAFTVLLMRGNAAILANRIPSMQAAAVLE